MAEKPTYEELEKRVQELEKIESEHKYSKEALWERESLFKMLYEKAPLGYQSLDENGQFIVVNQTWLDTLGYTREEVIGKSFADFLHPDWRDHFKENFPRFKSIGELLGVEFEMVKKNGDLILVSFTGKINRDKKGNFQQTHCIFHDITDRKRMEKALRESEEKYRILFEHTGEALFVAQDARIVFQNPRSTELLGYSAEEFQSKPFFDFIHEDDREMVTDHHIRRLRGEKLPERYNFRIIHKNGSILWAELNAVLFQWNGRPAVLCFMTDITKRKQIEDGLIESEALFRGMFKDHSAVMLLIDPDTGQIIKGNQAAVQYYGYPLEKMLQMKIQQLNILSPAEIMEKMGGAFNKQVNIFEFRHVLADGQIRDVEVHSTPIAIQNQTLLFSIIRDITEHKKAEEALKSNYSLLQTAGETATFGGWSVDLENNMCTWSDAVADIHDMPHGYAPPVQKAINFYAPEWREKITNIFSACAKDGIPYDEEMEIITQKGKRTWVRTTGKAVNNEKDKIIKVQGSFQDITERKQAEEVLAHQRKTYEQILDHSLAGYWDWDIPTGDEYLSPTFKKMFGYEDHEIENRAESWQKLIFAEDLPGVYEKFNQHIESKGEIPYYNEVRYHHKNGSTVWVICTGKVIEWDDDGKAKRMIGCHIDITARKQAEEEREKLQTQLNQAQKMESVGRLAGGVAHDFNNMLNIILGNTEMVMEDMAPDDPVHGNLGEILSAAKRSADITRQLLAFSRKQTIAPKVLNLNDTIESMLRMLRRLIGEDIDLAWLPGANIRQVRMDPSQIDQILANLCVNARDAIADVGKITIETGNTTFDSAYCATHPGFVPGDFVMLAVSDNGCGMDKNTLENIFEPFFTTKDVGKGTGLGLATIYGIVKQNNGFINVYSEPGHGSTFKIYLPRTFTDKNSDKDLPEKKAAAGGTETVLLVEDEPAILRTTRMMLERNGYSVISAATPFQALEKAKRYSGSIDLMMTDVIMPEMNGKDLAEQITILYPNIRILFMSGYTANVIVHHGVLDEGVAFIQKPFSMAELTEKIREVLDMVSDRNQG